MDCTLWPGRCPAEFWSQAVGLLEFTGFPQRQTVVAVGFGVIALVSNGLGKFGRSIVRFVLLQIDLVFLHEVFTM